MGQHGDERRQDVRIDGVAAQVARVERVGPGLHLAVVAERAERADEIAAELARELVLAGARRPAQRRERRRRAVAHQRLQSRPVGRQDETIQRAERPQQRRPHVLVALVAEAHGQLEVVGQGHEAGHGDRPRVVHEIEALDGAESREPRQQPPPQVVVVPHAVEAVTALVDDGRLEAGRQRTPRLRFGQQHALDGVAAAGRDPQLHGHLPARGGRRRGRRRPVPAQRLAEVREALLPQDQLAPLDADADQRIAGREDPAVHHGRNGLAGGASERRPQIAGVGVGEAMGAQVVAHAVTEDRGAEILLEHAKHRGALLVRQHIEHRVGLARRPHRELDRPRRMQPIDGERRRP